MKRIAGSVGVALFIFLAAASTGRTKDDAVADTKAFAGRDNQASAPRHETLVLPAGTSLIAVLLTRLSTDANSDGDPFVAITVEPIIVDGRTVVPAGSRIDGVLRDVQASGRIKDRARMTLVFQEIVDSAGKTHSMSASPLTVQAVSKTHNDVLKIAARPASDAVIGAAAGAGAGTILVLVTKGEGVELSQGVKLYVEMTGPTNFVVTSRR